MMNSKQRYNARRMTAHNAAKAAEANSELALSKNVATALAGGSSRVAKALSLTDYKASLRLPKQQKEWVAKQHNNVKNPFGQLINARQKIRGKSIPLI
ncbi:MULTISPECIES: hypothetical protein [Rahnella]|uniref:Antitermination protein n=1 Tax=Rahnella laticis TaxID=2787622 RepID=A0ABS0DZ20_9GAMM|nr:MULTISPECIES: hypothetical protein [Rahnella]MBF7978086.1 hypothetical protein [Rahnella laticis]MBF7998197.1 hypothetical protein [Rahnella sp. LAC-M12]